MRWYTEKLGFQKRTDQRLSEDFRWVSVAPPCQKDVEITLADWKWYGNCTRDPIGKNTTVVLESTSCTEDYENLTAKGIRFADPPRMRYGASRRSFSIYMVTRTTLSSVKQALEITIVGLALQTAPSEK